AHFVSVSDDPRFGNEYFLRADTLTAGLRWMSLFTGRFVFGSVSLSRPSLNLARDAEGNWNIESWLPPAQQAYERPGFVGPVLPSGDTRASRPTRIDVDGGRINFKQGDNKIPFALVEVSGRVEQNSAGRWQLDLEARPMRAGVALQDIGTLRVRGSIAGTTARLQPADLNLTWRAASVADALRLVRQDDYGMRGLLSVDLNARVAQPQTALSWDEDRGGGLWSISGVARLTGMHGWRLTERTTDPAANINVEMNWRLGDSHAEIRKLLVEMPASQVQGSGELDWAHGLRPELEFKSSTLALGDVLSWYRALQPGVAEDLRVDCPVGLDVKLGGWPIQLQQGSIKSVGGTLTAKSLPAPLQVGAINATVLHGGLDFGPTEVTFPAVVAPANDTAKILPGGASTRNSFVLRGGIYPLPGDTLRWPMDWNFAMDGATSRVQDWLALSTALAQPMNSDWSAEGGVAAKIRGAHRAGLAPVPWLGSMDFLGLEWRPSYINQPMRFSKAHIEFTPLQRTVTLSAAEAFGTVWRGSASRKYSDTGWAFDLSADQLDAAELDRWLGPRARPGFLARLTGVNAVATVTPVADAVVAQISAHGRLRASVINVSRMQIEKFDGEAEVAGRTVRIRMGQADFFGGKISGLFDAQLLPDPSYEFQGRFDRVNLNELAQTVPFLNGRMEGNASSTLTLSAHGVGRQGLISSLQGQGTVEGKNIALRGIDLSNIFPGNNLDNESETFSSVQGAYRILAGGIDLSSFKLDASRGRLEAEGRIDFSHVLNIRVHSAIVQASAAPPNVSSPIYELGGTIEIPKLVLPSAVPKGPARSSSR
ncbi:MAG TPA: AsmA-like C-terminal region-containing protein, partial [Candidatus Acidoferrales bacterium]|nr:AsmA-like C-terminal region-containing protein [Candidatus Acidoferrales bacterium]